MAHAHRLPARRRRHSGFSLLELVVVVILMSLLFLVALEKLLPLRGQAEAAAVLQNEGAMQAGLGQEVANRVLKRGFLDLPALAGSNPMDFMTQPPPNYLGAMDRVDPAKLPSGGWAFDRGRGVLVYRVRFDEYFNGQPDDPPRAEWRIEVRYAKDAEPTPENIRGVLLVPLGKPSWRPEGT